MKFAVAVLWLSLALGGAAAQGENLGCTSRCKLVKVL